MKYDIELATNNDINILIKYKYNNILDYAIDLSQDEIDEITKYVKKSVLKQVNEYKLIKKDDVTIGCFLIEHYNDGYLLSEIYLEEPYRNKGIGTDILKNILSKNKIVYLWVYKDNIKAYNLYKQLGFMEIKDTDSRYLLKYNI